MSPATRALRATPAEAPAQPLGGLAHDAVVLAGGAGERLGGVSKADVDLAGERLLDRVLTATTGATRTVVVGDVDVPEGVLRTVEEPPRSGPAAGIVAGLRALAAAGDPAPWVLVLATDRADVNKTVRKHLGVRKISFADQPSTEKATGMTSGGITPIGLPADWPGLVDRAVAEAEWVVIGGGVRGSKLLVSGAELAALPQAEVLDLALPAS